MAPDLHESARMMATVRWVEHRLFEILGRFATDEADPVVATMFGTHGHQHAWHAELWRDRIPAIPGVDVVAVPMAPGEATASAFDTVATTTGTAERLAAVYRLLLPRLMSLYERWRAELDPRLDGPTVRVLTLALRDDTDQLAEVNRRLTEKISDPSTARRAAAHLGELEAQLVESTGFTGPWPGAAV